VIHEIFKRVMNTCVAIPGTLIAPSANDHDGVIS
jgi:hypothetical protein